MVRVLVHKLLTQEQRRGLKKKIHGWNKVFTNRFFSYDLEAFDKALDRLEIQRGDTLMVHSSFDANSGFRGTPQEVVRCLCNRVGPGGNLLMVSMPYTCATSEYLRKNPVFDVQRTVSRMGIVSEVFRRRKHVLRSLHGTHPVLAWGKDAAWIVRDHEACVHPCGRGSPFDKFYSLHGKILFLNVPFRTFTFLHFIEDRIEGRLPFSVYTGELFTMTMKDFQGNEVDLKTHAFSETAVKTRNPDILARHLRREKLMKTVRIGRTRLMLVESEDAVSCTERLLERNITFYNPEAAN